MSVTDDCTPACEAQPWCATCGRRKSPRGRSVPMPAAGGYCARGGGVVAVSREEAERASLAELWAMQAAGDLPAFGSERRRTSAQRAATYHARREALIARLGGRCVEPGCGTSERLEFDHVQRRRWIAARTNRWTRIARYEREAAAGAIVLRCRSHNARKGKPERSAA